MKKTINSIKAILAFIVVVLLSTTSTTAQTSGTNLSQKKKPPRLLKLNSEQSFSLQNKQQLFVEVFNTNDDTSFEVVSEEQDQLGFVHQKMQQFYKQVKIEFGTLTLHSKQGAITSVSSEYYEMEDFDVQPNLSNQDAFQRAISHIGAEAYLWEDEAASRELGYTKPEGELVILPIFENENTRMALAYKFNIYTIMPLGGGDLYIDAKHGTPLMFNNKVRHVNNFGHDGRIDKTSKSNLPEAENLVSTFAPLVSGTAATRYSGTRSIETTLSGSSYILSDASRKVYTRNANNQGPIGNSLPYINNYSQFTDNDNNWTAAEHDNNDKDNAALDAHWGAMMTYDYWNTVHNRDSYDNNGAQLRSYVHVDNNYDNAFWFLNVMSYGDGSSNGNEGNGYFDALTSIDVAAHEIGHAVTEYTANLAYQRESGALNEAYSDIWGAAVEHFAKGNGNDANPDVSIWLIGDEIDRRNGSAALRSMNNPTSLGQPDTYGGSYWINPNCGTPTSNNDYCGVHTNSGVLNYWFYLTVVGGSGTNDIGNAFSVSGIGMTKSAAISYRAINVYLSANSDHADARTAMIQSAQDLYGADGAEEQAVTNAWHAVGVGAAYGGGGGNPTECETGDITLTITFDNYPEETAWTLKDSGGATIASASYSSANPDGSTVTETFSNLAADTYTFTITDSYGDGICCSYGSGSYSLTSSSGTINSGGNFGSSEATQFCIEDSGSDTEAPSSPTSVSASNIQQTTATLSWNAATDNVGVTGYEVFQGATSIGTTTGTSVNITGLTANTSYTFSIEAFDAAGNSSAPGSVSFTTLSDGGGSGSTVLHEGYFESGWDGWTDGGSDAFRYSGSRSYEGSYSIRLRDNTSSSTMTLGTIDVSTYNSIDIEFYFYAYSMESGEDFWVQFYDGSSWNTVATYARGSSFENNSFYTSTVTIDANTYTFPSNAQFRFRCDASGNQDHIYIDQVTITGNYGGATAQVQTSLLGSGPNMLLGDDDFTTEADFTVYPNPVRTELFVKSTEFIEGTTYKIVSILGQVLLEGVLTESAIPVQHLQTGMYIIELNDGEETVTQKFIKE